MTRLFELFPMLSFFQFLDFLLFFMLYTNVWVFKAQINHVSHIISMWRSKSNIPLSSLNSASPFLSSPYWCGGSSLLQSVVSVGNWCCRYMCLNALSQKQNSLKLCRIKFFFPLAPKESCTSRDKFIRKKTRQTNLFKK